MNEFLYITSMSFSHPDAEEPLFENISLQCQPGWTGIVGPNGGGKSTLLKLIGGELQPDHGAIICPGHVYYAEQRMDAPPAAFEEFLFNYDKLAIRLKDQLKIQTDWMQRWDTLSFGERKRCQVGVALAENPAVLLLDEPSNHLDHFSKTFLVDTLRHYTGIGLLVSHDRELLDTLCSHTIFIEPPIVEMRACPFSMAVEQRQREYTSLAHEREILNREVKKLKRRAQQQRQKAEAADKQRSKRDINRKDHDAKAKIDAARLSGKDAVQGRLFQRAQRQLARAEKNQQSIKIKKQYTLGVSYSEAEKSYNFPLTFAAGDIAMGESTLHVPELSLAAGEKIGLIGDNGTGKSTFLRHVVQTIRLSSEELIYIPQEIDIESVTRLMQRIHNLNDAAKGEMMTIIRRLGSEPERVLQTLLPSPGEVRKLLLAEGLQKKPSLIIMDEPTNHMDLPSIQCIEQALVECACALLLVSHDYIFLQHIVSYFWAFERTAQNSRIIPRLSIL